MVVSIAHATAHEKVRLLAEEAASSRPASLASQLAGFDTNTLCARLGCGVETVLWLQLDDQPCYEGNWELEVGEIARRHDVDPGPLATLIAEAQWGAGDVRTSAKVA